MQAADQERNSWWERFLSANTRRPFNLCPNNCLLHLLSERTSVEERGLFTRFGLRAMKPESSHLPALALRFGPLKKADVPEVNAFSAIAETTK